jgi:hypothetical protein
MVLVASGCAGGAFADYEKIAVVVEFKLADGGTVSGDADFGIGNPANTLHDKESRQRTERRSLLNGKPSRRQCQ